MNKDFFKTIIFFASLVGGALLLESVHLSDPFFSYLSFGIGLFVLIHVLDLA